MDEQLLKKTVESIEMPEDMKERIIENCKSGEAKPLILPKKRVVYMPTAVTACVCVLVLALAVAGIWQLKSISDEPPALTGDNDGTAEDIINVIPLSDEDLDTVEDAYKSGYGPTLSSYDGFVMLTEEEINKYYGIDTGSLLSGLGFKPTVFDENLYDGWGGSCVFRACDGEGEIYFDTNAFIYGEDEEICVYISKIAIPLSIPKLWSNGKMLSTISGVTAAVGRREDGDWQQHNRGVYQYRTEFKLEQYGLYFNVWCDYDMIGKVVSAIKTQCDRQLSPNEPETAQPLTLDKLLEICKGDTSKLSWDDFKQFKCSDIGSGLYILQYNIEDKYTLTIGGVPEEEPWYMMFHVEGQYYSIDIREDSIGEYLSQPIPEGDFINLVPLTEDEINYFMSADFSDSEQVFMTDEQLSEYYGLDITAFGSIPPYMEAEAYTHNDGKRCIWQKDDGTIYYDKNTFSFSNPDHSAWIDISMGRLINYNEKLWEDQKLRSRIGDRDVAIGKAEQEHYVAEFRSGDYQIFIVVNAYGISTEELHDVIAALVEQTYDEHDNFDIGIQYIVQVSETVEELYQELQEFDMEGRIDEILVFYRGEAITEGKIKEGVQVQVSYDDGASRFECTF